MLSDVEAPLITLAKASEVYKQVIYDISKKSKAPIHPELFELYKNNYHKAIRSVFGPVLSPVEGQPEYGSKYFEHAAKFELNTARFAAYKSHYATQTLIKSFQAAPEKFAMNSGKILKQFARWQATEYNTTVARCRTAKQFEQFQAEAHLYPNLEWLATRSATPRELHMSFVGIVLPMDDPFWEENQPGNLYNCKCDWKTTDAPTTGSPTKVVKPAPGLEGNPAKTGQIFTDKHPYFKKTKDKMFINVTDAEYQHKLASLVKFVNYDDNWEKVLWNAESAGYNVYHKQHQFNKNGGPAEKYVGKLLANNEGKWIEFLPEFADNKQHADLFFDNQKWDVKYLQSAKVETIRKYIKESRKKQNVIFYFENSEFLKQINVATLRTEGHFKSKNRLDEMPNIYYVIKDGKLKQLWKKS